jgi:hypothetical protein
MQRRGAARRLRCDVTVTRVRREKYLPLGAIGKSERMVNVLLFSHIYWKYLRDRGKVRESKSGLASLRAEISIFHFQNTIQKCQPLGGDGLL